MSAAEVRAIELARGATPTSDTGRAESDAVDEQSAPTRYIDAATELLGDYASTWRDFQQMRLAATHRGLSEKDIAVLQDAESHFARALTRALRRHDLYGWLPPGTRGVHVARLIARIGDPRRFPGQQCDQGHTFTPRQSVSSTRPLACPFSDEDGNVCPGRVLPPRTTTGTRSLWHYLGLHVVDGRSPRKTKGQRADWDPLGRTAVLQPGGIAEQIVRLRVEPWRTTYDETKARLEQTRGVESDIEDEVSSGSAGLVGPEADPGREVELARGLRPFQIDAIARKVAAKAFVADLLAEWKRRADGSLDRDDGAGPVLP